MKKSNYSKILAISISVLLLIMGSVFLVMAEEKQTVYNANGKEVGYSIAFTSEQVSSLRNVGTGAHQAPDAEEGYVFAGWYQDAACKQPWTNGETDNLDNNLVNEDAKFYAKFVYDDILNNKMQIIANTDSTKATTTLRLITTVDSLNYDRVGFYLTMEGKTYTYSAQKVYRRLYVVGASGEESPLLPTDVHTGSMYFLAVNITGIPEASYNSPVTAVPYWVTYDGTTVQNSNVEDKSVALGMSKVCEAHVTNESGKDKYYLTLEKAFYVLNGTNDYLVDGDTVTVIQDDVEIANRLNVYTNITLTNEANRDVVITRSHSDSHFIYYKESTLTVEGTVPEGDGQGSLTFDGETVSNTRGFIESGTEGDSNLTLENVSIKNILTTRSGGAVKAHGTATITGCTFKNNIININGETVTNGGAIYFNGSEKTLTVDACEFISNQATSGDGGAIYVYQGTANISGSSFESNSSAETSGGAIYIYLGTTTISETEFNSNAATSGGALYVWRAVANVSGCTFTSNASTEANGGAIYHGEDTTYGKTLTLTNCTFDSNHTASTGYGGAVYMNYGPATVSGSTFKNNGTAGADFGGALYVNDGTTTISDSDFSSNQATSKGGAVYDNLGTVTIQETCNFSENSAANGGALYVYQGTTGISNSTFTSNESTEANGGAIYFGEDIENLKELTLTGCTFDSNNTVSAGHGGAVYMNCGTATVSGSTFASNGTDGADMGGAIYVNQGTTTISGTEFNTNAATTGGGAVYDNSGIVTIQENCNFLGNSAKNGGALYDSAGTTIVSNSTFTSNVSSGTGNADGGGAIHYRGAAGVGLKLTDCTFNSNNASNRAGAVYIYEEGANIAGSTFTSNGQKATTKNGGAIYVRTGAVEISGTSFESNKATVCGGAVYAHNHNDTTVTVSDSTFTSNGLETTPNGGAIYTQLGTTIVSNTTFESNKVATNGGALYTLQGELIVNNGCEFTSNTAQTSGGAIYVDTADATLSVSASTFNTNQATGNGGAVYDNLGTVTVENSCSFEGNSAASGGALYVYQGTTTGISGSTFTSNASTEANGGAIYFGEDTENVKELTLTNCTFTSNNTASAGYGGAVYMNSGTATVSGSTFTSNGTDGADMGGAIYVNAGTTTISGSGFSLNTATTRGGAVYDNAGSVTIQETCIFSENSAADGGALYEHNGATTVSDSSFTGNVSEGTNGGGAIYFRGNGEDILTLDSCTFSSNKATGTSSRGGAVYVYRGSAEVAGSEFTSNGLETTPYGGAIYVRMGTTTVSNTTFDSNKVATNGGALYNLQGTLVVNVDCTFTANKATSNGGAIYVDKASATLEVSASEFSANDLNETNEADMGGAIYVNAGTVTISDSGFSSNEATSNGGAIYSGADAENSTTLTLTGCTFTSNDMASTGNGGAVYVNSGTAGISGSTFTSNGTTGADMGGAIYVNAGTTTISGSGFSSNQATSNGGAIYENSGELTIKESCTFSQNSAAEGGALYNLAGTTDVSNSSFTSNISNSETANAGGGAIHYRSAAGEKLKLTNCSFTSNEATTNTSARGGAVYVYTGGAEITGSTFISNGRNATTQTATTVNGGAIYVRSGKTEISDTDFEGNKAITSGGAVYMHTANADVDITDGCIFSENSAATSGGAIFVHANAPTLNVSDSTFTSNGLETTLNGGAIYVSAGTTTISNTEFDSNKVATNGGALYNLQGELIVNNGCTFTSNVSNGAEESNGGGAIYVDKSSATLEVSDSTFTSNRGSTTNKVIGGGAICFNAATGTISNSDFDQNYGRRGGAIHVYEGEVTIENGCTFSGNNAARGGALYYHSNGDGSVTDAVIVGNTATVGGVMQCYKAIQMDGCMFDQNSATSTDNAIYSAKETFALTNTTLINQTEADFQDQNTRITLLTQANDSATTNSVDNIHDADDGHQLSLLTNMDEAGFEAYCERIEFMGFVLKSENTMGADTQTVARTYYSAERGYMLHTYWVEYSQEVRTQVAEMDESMLASLVALDTVDSTETTEVVCTPLFHQLEALSYDSNVSDVEGGMGYIVRLTDGRFVVIDGGTYLKKTDATSNTYYNNAYEILKFMAENTVLKDDNGNPKVVIAAWMFTHAHDDHIGAFEYFVRYTSDNDSTQTGSTDTTYYDYWLQAKVAEKTGITIANDGITLESIMFNSCDTEAQMTCCSSAKSSLIDSFINVYVPNTPIYKPLTGQEYRFADTSIEILHTMSDFLPQTIAQEPDGNGGDYNVQTVVSMVDIDCHSDKSDKFFIMGDTTKVACDEMSKRYGTYMESDYVQVAHHGYNEFTNYVGTDLEYKNSRRHGATQEIYELILKDDNSTIVMWPTSDVRFAAKTLADTTATGYIAINDWLYRTGQPDASKHWIAESVSDENRTIEFE